MVRLLLDSGHGNIDARDNTGTSALMYASSHNHQDICALLIDRGARLNLKVNDYYFYDVKCQSLLF